MSEIPTENQLYIMGTVCIPQPYVSTQMLYLGRDANGKPFWTADETEAHASNEEDNPKEYESNLLECLVSQEHGGADELVFIKKKRIS